MILGQCLSLAAEYRPHHESDHCCLLCHSGPLPFEQGSQPAASAPVLSFEWLASPAPVDAGGQVSLPSSTSRAPPA